MRVETSKQTENMFSQLKIPVAEGKRKGESEGLALSLQDVFSDSANLEGMQEKTSRRSKMNGRKEAQLQGKYCQKTKRNPKGGRSRLQQRQKRIVKLQAHVIEEEYENLNEQFQASGIRFLSDYMRLLILDKRKTGFITNKNELIKQLDRIGAQISRIGNNINQITKYANIQLKTGKIDQRTITRFNNQMEGYLKQQKVLTISYRALARNEA